MPIKRHAWTVASLIATTACATGCGGKPPGKAELAQACRQRTGGVQQKCDCYVASIEKALTPDPFSQLAPGVDENRNYAGAGWLPNKFSRIPAIGAALHDATANCLASA